MAKKNVENERYFAAIKDFEALEAKSPYGKYSDKAQLGLIYAHFKNKDFDSALSEVDRFIKLHPNHQNVDYAYYLKGLINYEANFSVIYKYLPIDRSKREPTQAKQSFEDFKFLLKKFPKSIYLKDARKRMIVLKEQLAKHELYVANFYFNKGAYLAASNRANHILKEFDKTKSTKEALMILIKSYNKLGMHELEKESINILNKNFPDKK